MRDEVLFSSLTPTVEEVQKRFTEIEKEDQTLTENISEIENRLKDAETIYNVVSVEDKGKVAAYQRSLALNSKDAAAIGNELSQTKAKAFEKRNEIEGLQALLNEKKAALKALQKEVQERDHLLALAELYPLFDEYNKQAAALSETLRRLIPAHFKAKYAAQACGVDPIQYVNPTYGNGIPEELPAIIQNANPDTTHGKKFHFHLRNYLRDLARGN